MGRGFLAGFAATLIIGGAGAWYFASPGYAMKQLREAAISGDRDELAERIDFPAVRESLRGELSAAMAAEVARNPAPDGFEALGSALAMSMVGEMVDSLVTPEGMAAMVRRGHFQKPADATASANGQPVEWHIERDGIDRFTAAPEKGDDPKAPTLVFDRDGLSWRLVRIALPESALAGTG